MATTIIVSNRLPVSVRRVDGKLVFEESSGGLATGLASYTKNRKSVWIGWPGIAGDELTETDKTEITETLLKQGCLPVFLTKEQVDGFYSGYSNTILWPLFHQLPFDITDHKKYWNHYRRVNELFAEVVASVAKSRSKIWVHDYQLLLLPELLRTTLEPTILIGLFSHIPFPPYKTLKELPQAKQLLRGMLGASLVGFHTTNYGDDFMDCCNKLDVGSAQDSQVIINKRVIKVADFPIGIDYKKFASAVKSKKVQWEILKLKRKYGKYKLILTVDRLDPSKGFVERLEAYLEFLNRNPHLHKKVKMVMLTIPSRTDVKAYKELKEKIDELVARINKKHGSALWRPIDFMYKSVPFHELSALYHVADVAFVAPIRDGMNLVAKEYIASKQNRDGVLILSETAGAAQELAEAVLVNPRRRTSLVQGLDKALSMTHRPITTSLNTMQEKLSSNTIHTWAKQFVDSMDQTTKVPVRRTHSLTQSQFEAMKEAYKNAERRVFFFDYDGVIAHIKADPSKTPLNESATASLIKLGNTERNELIIISGRTKPDLEAYAKDLPVKLVAEHGAFIRNKTSWRSTVTADTSWKNYIQPVLERYTEKTPLSRVEVKNYTLVWHFRESPVYAAQKNLAILKRVLKPLLSKYGLVAYEGKKVLEIKPPSVNKGSAMQQWLDTEPDFVLIIGDDYTDEEMFAAAPNTAYTIKVGPGRTVAKYRLADVDLVHELLEELIS